MLRFVALLLLLLVAAIACANARESGGKRECVCKYAFEQENEAKKLPEEKWPTILIHTGQDLGVRCPLHCRRFIVVKRDVGRKLFCASLPNAEFKVKVHIGSKERPDADWSMQQRTLPEFIGCENGRPRKFK